MPESAVPSEPPPGNRSVARALAILELLARTQGSLGLAEIAKAQELPKSSVLSLLRALAAASFVRLDEDGRYLLGIRSFEVGSAYLRQMTPLREVEAELRHLTEALAVTSHFAVIQGEDVVYLAKHDPPQGFIRLASSLGARLPATSTAVGLAQLAYRQKEVAARWPHFAPVLQRVRAVGYAVDSGSTALGIQCVAAPVFDGSGCCGAVGVSYLQQGAPEIDIVAAAVADAARSASGRLCGIVPSDLSSGAES
ncbi:IclR family transcriptional regulator [Streptomyces canus]|uniref:IclR family transcriptional regulator n=1 Tax=Streptomyces canus TaxID=58343 RepID=UPI0033BEE738